MTYLSYPSYLTYQAYRPYLRSLSYLPCLRYLSYLKYLPCLLCLSSLPQPALAQSADNVLLVINDSSNASIAVGEYYARQRAIPDDHVVRVKTSTEETIQRDVYLATIEVPIGAWLARHSLEDRVLYIVLTKGVPLRVNGTGGRDGTAASVDSELTLLYRKMVGEQPSVVGTVANPLYLDEQDPSAAKPVTRFDTDLYLVTRLDGFTVDDVVGLIDRGLKPGTDGRIVLDQKSTLVDRGGDEWLEAARERLKATPLAERVTLETTRTVASSAEPVLGYYSWGSNDPSNQLRRFNLKFSPGAIGGMFVSTDGRTFMEPPTTWTPSPPTGGPVYRGSFQSLAGDLIRDGITGIAAHVNEPFLDATIRPQILFPAYVSGLNLAESFYRAMPYLSWQTVVIGDPLCRPFAGKTLAPEEIAQGPDPETGLPALLSARRLAHLSEGGLNPDAVKLMLRRDAEVARGDSSNVESLLLKATELEPMLVGGHLQLAQMYEERKDHDRAIERYRKIIEIEPDNFLALNNLAYSLAENKGAPGEALPLAERAFRLARDSPMIIDTLGWVHHLNGDERAAGFFLDQAVLRGPGILDVRIHAAIVHAALGNAPRARAELAAVEKINPAALERPEVKTLRDRLGQP